MLWGLIGLLLVAWLVLFFAFHITMWAIHLLLVIAVIMLVIRLFTGRSAA
jgi:hypothetical protein